MNKFLTPSEVLRAVAVKEISKQTLEDCRELAAYYTDSKTGKKYVGFIEAYDGPNVLEVDDDQYTVLVSVGRVMSKFQPVYNTPNGMNGILKIRSMVDRFQRKREELIQGSRLI